MCVWTIGFFESQLNLWLSIMLYDTDALAVTVAHATGMCFCVEQMSLWVDFSAFGANKNSAHLTLRMRG